MSGSATRFVAVAGVGLLAATSSVGAFTPRPELEIHIINVQQAAAAVVIGPGADGKRVLLDAGHYFADDNATVPTYLTSPAVQLLPLDGFHYTFASHLHTDHIKSFKTLFVDPVQPWVIHSQNPRTTCINCYNGNEVTSGMAGDYRTSWLTTSGGGNPEPVEVRQPPAPPQAFWIGDGAKLEVLAANGHIAGGSSVTIPVSNKNARSIVLLITYGDFQFIWGGDATGESSDCFEAGSVKNIEGGVVDSVKPMGTGTRKLTADGVDVMHVNHHGSESSTCADWMNIMRPEVALISVGRSTGHGNPDPQVVDNILLAENTSEHCVSVDPALVLQTDEGVKVEDGIPISYGESRKGFVVGDIIIRSNGSTFSIETTGRASYGPDESGIAGLGERRTYLVDEAATDCPMVKFLTEPFIHESGREFKAKHSVTAKGDLVIQAGGGALFEAGTQVVLSDGFAVEDGGEFVAAIRPLTDCS